jgi:hypothetical protein
MADGHLDGRPEWLLAGYRTGPRSISTCHVCHKEPELAQRWAFSLPPVEGRQTTMRPFDWTIEKRRSRPKLGRPEYPNEAVYHNSDRVLIYRDSKSPECSCPANF